MNQSNAPVTIPINELEHEELEFLYEPYVPSGTFISVQGPGGVGKSSLAAWMAAQVTTGAWGEPGDVIHIGDEDHFSRVFDRLEWLGADTSRYHYWNVEDHLSSFPSNAPLLERQIEKLNAKLVIIDTATEYLDEGLNINEAQDVTSALKPLRAVAQRTGCSIIGISHLNRVNADEPSKLAGASKAWYDRAKSVLFLGKDPDTTDSVHMFHVKFNYTEQGSPLEFQAYQLNRSYKLELAGESDRTFSEVFKPKVDVKPSKTDQTDGFLRGYVNDDRLPVTLEELEAHFEEKFGEDSVADPISLKTLGKRRKEQGWISTRVKGITYVGRPCDVKDLTA
jgi:hypothetical protein